MSVCCLSCVIMVVWSVGFVSWQRVSVACFPPNNIIKDIADLWWVRALYVWLVVRTDGLEFEERTRRCRVGGPLSSGRPEGDGEGLYLVTYWPNKQ